MLSTADRREWEETQIKSMKKFLYDVYKTTQAQTTVEDIVHNHKRFLKDERPARIKSYCDLLKSQPASARAEAVVFHFLKANLEDVRMQEDPETGGVDFQCQTSTAKFMVEVTCLEAESVTRKSGLKNEPPQNHSSGWYSDITQKLHRTVQNKVKQVSGYDCPRLLVIGCEHPQADMLLDTTDAEFLLTGKQRIPVVPFSNRVENRNLVTDLGNSVFFRYNRESGQLESCRCSISAILLFSIFGANVFVVGILHSDPVHKFPIEFLPEVPFVRLKKWPPENDMFEIEWINYKKSGQVTRESEPYNFWYAEELRST